VVEVESGSCRGVDAAPETVASAAAARTAVAVRTRESRVTAREVIMR
jgi:hypothetical protein